MTQKLYQVSQGLNAVQESLSHSYQELINCIISVSEEDTSRENNRAQQENIRQLQDEIKDKNRVILALVNSLSNKNLLLQQWGKVADYFAYINEKGVVARAEDIERLLGRSPPDTNTEESLTTISPFVAKVMTRNSPVLSASDSVQDLTELLKQNVTLVDELRLILKESVEGIQQHMDPVLKLLQKLSFDAAHQGNSDAAKVFLEINETTKHDLEKFGTFLEGTQQYHEGDDEIDSDHTSLSRLYHQSICDSVELARKRLLKSRNSREKPSDESITNECRMSLERIEANELEVITSDLKDLQTMMEKYESVGESRGRIERSVVETFSPGQSNVVKGTIGEAQFSKNAQCLCGCSRHLALPKDFHGKSSNSPRSSINMSPTQAQEPNRADATNFDGNANTQIPESSSLIEPTNASLNDRINHLLFIIRRKISRLVSFQNSFGNRGFFQN